MTSQFYLYTYLFVIMISHSSCSLGDSLKDPRDGQVYKTKEMKDGKIWMTQNLNYSSSESWCFRDEDKNCDKFGRLYSWESAKVACPKGWHLPTDEEWWNFASFYGKAYSTYFGKSHNGTFQKDKKNNKYDAGEEALELLKDGGSSGISLLFSGYRLEDGTYYTSDNVGAYWTSSEYKSSGSGWYYFIMENSKIHRNFGRNKALAYSCRCVKD